MNQALDIDETNLPEPPVDLPRPTTPIDLLPVLDGDTSAATLINYAFLQRQASGDLPFVAEASPDVPFDVSAVLPCEAVIERQQTSGDFCMVLARLDGASVLISQHAHARRISVASTSQAESAAIVERLADRVSTPPPSDKINVEVWNQQRFGFAPQTRTIDVPEWCEISRNYPAATGRAFGELIDLERPASGGRLILLHGPSGTGKSTAIQALLRAWAPWCVGRYAADPSTLFNDPNHVSTLLGSKPSAVANPDADWQLIIAEDADDVIKSRDQRGSDRGAVSRLLNLADGVLGIGSNALFLLTTNEPIDHFDPAVVRPGRCLASIEFPALDQSEASDWLGRPVSGKSTLAELFLERGDIKPITAVSTSAGGEQSPPVGQYL